MAWAAGGSLGTNSSTTSGTSLSITTTGVVAVGRVLICSIAKDNAATTADGASTEVSSITDTRSNTWTKIREFCNGNGSANTGAIVSVWRTQVTTQIESGDTVAITFAQNVASKCAHLFDFTVAAGSTISAPGTQSDLANDAADPGSMSTSGLANVEHLQIRSIALESNSITALTPTASWTAWGQALATTGTDGTSMTLRNEYRILTATGATSDPTCVAKDCASVMFALLETAAATGCPKQSGHLMRMRRV